MSFDPHNNLMKRCYNGHHDVDDKTEAYKDKVTCLSLHS